MPSFFIINLKKSLDNFRQIIKTNKTMGNSHNHIKLREQQHILFYELTTDKINFNLFRINMIKLYNQMDPTLFLGYHTLLKNGFITNKESALRSKYEFNIEIVALDPFPIGHFQSTPV